MLARAPEAREQLKNIGKVPKEVIAACMRQCRKKQPSPAVIGRFAISVDFE